MSKNKTNDTLVHRIGFEPTTLCSEDRCSNPLSYRCEAPFPLAYEPIGQIKTVNSRTILVIPKLEHWSYGESGGTRTLDTLLKRQVL